MTYQNKIFLVNRMYKMKLQHMESHLEVLEYILDKMWIYLQYYKFLQIPEKQKALYIQIKKTFKITIITCLKDEYSSLGVTAIRALAKSNGYVSAWDVNPANEPARKRRAADGLKQSKGN